LPVLFQPQDMPTALLRLAGWQCSPLPLLHLVAQMLLLTLLLLLMLLLLLLLLLVRLLLLLLPLLLLRLWRLAQVLVLG
jgi:hypothetical protein